MNSELMAPLVEKDSVMPETSGNRSYPSKKNRGKVPKRIHKSEREKLKREHLNDLFLNLANALELTEQNNGKASVLTEATRILRDMLVEVESLKRENAVLLSESQYVAMEKNELRDETCILENQIKKLQNEIEANMAQLKPDLNVAPPEIHDPELTSHFVDDHLRLPTLEPSLPPPPPPVVGPLYVIPFSSSYHGPDATHRASDPKSNVSKPHARYPTSADSWSSQLLGQQPKSRGS